MKNLKLTEKDLRGIFGQPSFWEKAREVLWTGLKFLFSFSLLFVFFFVLINFPAYWQKFNFGILGAEKYSQKLSEEDKQVIEPLVASSSQALDAPRDKTTSHLPQNRLVIPKLKINVPIVWEVGESEIIEKLKQGIVHYQGTNLPGENGNVFITGHSSNFWWDEGSYKQVFALLEKLEPPDKIFITYNQNLYIYEVEGRKIVNPSQIEVLKPSDHSILSLMTCYPVGTTINRLIVTAKQIYPEAQANQPPSPKSTPSSNHLPVIR